MGSLSNIAENYVLDAILGDKHTEDFPDNVYVALFLESPTDGGGGTEVAASEYSRVEVANTSANWPDASGSVKSNAGAITFPMAFDDWGPITHWALYSESLAGFLICYGAFSEPLTPTAGSTPYIPAGVMRLEAD